VVEGDIAGDGDRRSLHRFYFGDAGVGHAVHVAVKQLLFVLRRQIAIVRHAFVKIVRDQIEKSSSKLAPVHEIICTLSCRIISARLKPNSAVDIAPASVIIILPPAAMCCTYPSDASISAAELK
jgi:hypothetical protein